MRFAARTGEAGRGVRERHPAFRDVEALLWVEGARQHERVYAGSDATLQALRYLGGRHAMLGRFGGLVPRPLREVGYGIVARLRKRIFGRVDPACMVVPAGERHRFVP